MGTFLLLFFILFLFIYFMEIHFCEKMSSYYFNKGPIIYRKSFNIGDSDNSNVQFVAEKMGGNFKINIQTDGNIYFREKYFLWWPGINLMCGKIIIRKNNSSSIIGRLNLSPVVFSMLFVTVLFYFSEMNLYVISGIILIIFYLLIVYLIPKRRYNEISRIIRKS